MTFKTLHKSNFSGMQAKTNVAVKTDVRWERIWEMQSVTRSENVDLPEVDFERDMVLVAAMGQQRTGGFSIEIVEVLKKQEAIEVYLRETTPAPGGMRLQAITSPIHIVRVPRSDLPVRFLPAPPEEEPNE